MEINKTMQKGPVNDKSKRQIITEDVKKELEILNSSVRQADNEIANRDYWAGSLKENQKSFGDSWIMKKVKSDLAGVENSRKLVGVQNYTEEEFQVLIGTYFNAISSCRQYLKERSAT